MGKWIKQGGVSVPITRPKREKWVCDFGEEHFGVAGECQCGDYADVEEPHDGRDPRGFTQVRHSRKRAARVADNRKHYAIAYTREEARKNGITPPKRHRKKAPTPNAPMWLMDKDQRARAGSRMRSL